MASGENWLNAPLLGGQSDKLTLNLPGGEYLFLLNPAFGVTALTGYTLNVLEDHVYSVDSLTTSTRGNVLSDDIAPAGTLVTRKRCGGCRYRPDDYCRHLRHVNH